MDCKLKNDRKTTYVSIFVYFFKTFLVNVLESRDFNQQICENIKND